MLQFSLFGFPVQIHWLFWLNSALLGGALSATTPQQLRHVAVWIIVVFVSILIHELGHAFTMRKFGDRRVQIALYAFGGLAMGSIWQTRWRQILISAAGPLTQVAAGLALWGLIILLPPIENATLRMALGNFIFVSVVWSLFNLLPIIPLDGGRITEAFLGPRQQRLGIVISLVVSCLAVLVFLLYFKMIFAGIFFAMLAYNNFQSLNRRPEVPWMDMR